MTELTAAERTDIYTTWWQTKVTVGKWMALVRLGLAARNANLYFTFGHHARVLRTHFGLTVIPVDELGTEMATFSQSALEHLRTELNRRGYRVLIVDAPAALQRHKERS